MEGEVRTQGGTMTTTTVRRMMSRTIRGNRPERDVDLETMEEDFETLVTTVTDLVTRLRINLTVPFN